MKEDMGSSSVKPTGAAKSQPRGERALDEFGDRMKAYEAVEDRRLQPGLPIYARIDGRSFSRFTRGMARPFDTEMTAAMVATCKALVGHTHARIGYTQSDEISLVWQADGDGSQTFFDGRVQRLCSVLAGLATAHFTAASKKGMSAKQLQRMMGLASYESAWFLFHRLRECPKPASPRGPIGGEGKTVEADETYIGGKESNKHRNKRVVSQFEIGHEKARPLRAGLPQDTFWIRPLWGAASNHRGPTHRS